jgi:hypothetical protein
VNWNGKHLLKDCLDSVFAQTYKDFEVVLVDNASSDGSAEFVKKNYPKAKIVENASNAGYAQGANAGVKASDAEAVVLLNNDTKVERDWLKSLLAPLKRDPGVGAAGSKLLFYDNPEYINSVGTFVSVFGFSGSLGDSRPREEFGKEIELFAPSGGAAAVRKKLYIEVGGLYEPYFMYEDDVDLGWKVWNAGFRVVLAPDAIVYHKYSHAQRPYKYYYITRNKQWSFWKNARAIDLLWLYPAGMLFSLALASSFIITLRLGSAWQVLRGVADGAHGLPKRDGARNNLAARHYTGVRASLRIFLQKFQKHVA